MSEQLLEAFIQHCEQIGLVLHGITVLQHGHKIAEKRWKPDIRQNVYSAGKSFTSTAIGIAIEEGLLSLEDRVLDFFPEEAPIEPQEELYQLTLRHLLTMSTGHRRSLLMGDERWKLSEKNWVRYFLHQPMAWKPGQRFVYSSGATYIAGVMLQTKAGQTLVDYLMPRLLEPLGIPHPEWETCPKGFTFGGGGLQLCTNELAKLGQLYLQGGRWNGTQLVPENWVHEATKKQIDTKYPGNGRYGYGYCFWLGKLNSYRADGRYGQFSIILQEKDAVIAITAHEEKQDDILECVWQDILPLL